MSIKRGKIEFEKLDESEQELVTESVVKIKYLKDTDRYCVLLYGEKVYVSASALEYLVDYDKLVRLEQTWNSPDVADVSYWELDRKVIAARVESQEEYTRVADDISYDTYVDLCLLQYKYNLPAGLLKKVKRTAHLRRLGRVETAWIELSLRKLPELNFGQKKNKKRVVSERNERIEYNIANYDKLVAKFVEKDWLEDFCEFELEIAKYLGKRVSLKAVKSKFLYLRGKLTGNIDNNLLETYKKYEYNLL